MRRGAARHARRTAVVSGGRVGLLIGNGIWSIPVDFGCLKAGAARVPLNVRLAVGEQAAMLAATGVRLLVHDVALADRAGELAARVDGLRLASLGPAPGALDLLAEMKQASAADPHVPA